MSDKLKYTRSGLYCEIRAVLGSKLTLDFLSISLEIVRTTTTLVIMARSPFIQDSWVRKAITIIIIVASLSLLIFKTIFSQLITSQQNQEVLNKNISNSGKIKLFIEIKLPSHQFVLAID